MIKHLLFYASCFAITLNSFAQNPILNPGFENWDEITLEIPNEYETDFSDLSYNDDLPSQLFVNKSIDATLGSFSAELSSEMGPDSSVNFGYVILGVIDEAPESGVPYTFEADSFCFDYKSDIAANDTGAVIYTFFKNGAVLDGGQIALTADTATTSQWRTLCQPLDLGVAPDSVFFAAVCTDVLNENPKAGSVLKIDNVRGVDTSGASVLLPNGDFSMWYDTTLTQLQDWNTNIMTANKDANAVEGNYALSLEVKTAEQNDGSIDTVSAQLYNFDWNGDGQPFTNIAGNFSGSINYNPQGIDSARVFIQFLDSLDQTVSYNQKMYYNNTSGYVKFDLPLNFSGTPASFLIGVEAGNNPGTKLLIDDLLINGIVTSSEEISSKSIAIFPNPASDVVTISSNGIDYYNIFDISGKLIKEGGINSNQTSIDISDLNSGTYVVALFNEGVQKSTSKLLIK